VASILGKGAGLFKLDDSDQHPGSFFTLDDLVEIFGAPRNSFQHLASQVLDGQTVFDEKDIQSAWYSGNISGAPDTKVRNFSRSFDELVLLALIKKTYPDAEIEEQVKWGRKSLDFIVHRPNFDSKIIEFQGPGHFAPRGYAKEIQHPSIRKDAAQEELKMEYIDWPYWIQRCVSNVKSIYEPEVKGFGLLWSANVHFGDFIFDDSASIILQMSKRFNALRNDGLGYIYGPNTAGRENVEHPIIAKIEKGRVSPNKLLPKGYKDPATWLPSKVLVKFSN
jgi:hypothetical protein